MKDLLDFARSVFEKTRLRMLRILLDRELCVCEVAEIFQISQPRASQHLQMLRRAGAVNERREGKWVYYSARPEAVERFTRAWQEYLQAGLREIPQLAGEVTALNSEKLRILRESCVGGDQRSTKGKTRRSSAKCQRGEY